MSALYIHIPFCRSKCGYCGFYSLAARAVDADAFVGAVAAEMEARVGGYPLPFATMYIGGGTPSVLPPAAISALLAMARPYLAPDAEITIEANPDDVTPALASLLAAEGVNRVSMGVQSLVDSELAAIGRRHDAAAAIRAVDTLRQAGITNISCDLIFGLPGQTPESFGRSLEGLTELRPDHISSYLLSIEPGTRFARDVARGAMAPVADDMAETCYSMLCSHLAAEGYRHYEISNFALPGRESHHNSSYWDPASAYLGLGPAAHSYNGTDTRRANVASLRRYLASPADAADPELTEVLTSEQRYDELVMLSLRTSSGLDPAVIPPAMRSRLMKAAAPWLERGHLLTLPSGALRIAESSWLIADAITADLFA